MQIQMQNVDALRPEQLQDFLRGSQAMQFAGQNRAEIYAWIGETLTQQEYLRQGKKDRGLIRQYLMKVAGKSRAQITRLIQQYACSGEVRWAGRAGHRFGRSYSERDIALLAEVDRAHERLSGPATKCILDREWRTFGRLEFKRLAAISVSHLYNLRRRDSYRKRAAEFEKTRPTNIAIGQRRRPDPGGRPGYLRVDTVHQGDYEGEKGVYHINAVDEVTQWEVVGCAERISEQHLAPVLEAMLHQFPFLIRGFHADNGSEFVNHTVARLLNKLMVEQFTRSRANRTQDNALVEGKNGAIIRKHIGYGRIAGEHAERLHQFYAAHFNPYLNYHRPCGFATLLTDRRGRRRRVYRAADYMTPYEKLKSLPDAEQTLKPGITWELLDQFARRMSDTEWARKMRQAKIRLLQICKSEWPTPPHL
jgi:hypothetical protein